MLPGSCPPLVEPSKVGGAQLTLPWAALNMSSTFSGGMGDPSLTTFSPAECLVGGIFIGISVVARAFALGTVTGISGIFGSTVRFESLEKAFFSIGVFLSGVALFWGSPAPFLRVPDDLPVYRPIVAAILVAVGTHYGNGCTRCSARVSCNLICASRCCASDADCGAVATAYAGSRGSAPAHSLQFQYSCAYVAESDVPFVQLPHSLGRLVFSSLLCRNRRETSACLTSRTLRLLPRLQAPLHLSSPAAPAAGDTSFCAVQLPLHLMCNTSFFPSVLLAILYFLKRSDTSAAETAPAASPDYVPASGAAQAAVAPIPREKQLLLFALETVSGFLFGSGLVVAGMVNPAKVRTCTHVSNVINSFRRSLHSCPLFLACMCWHSCLQSQMANWASHPAAGSIPLAVCRSL
jgi:hypothetical protein